MAYISKRNAELAAKKLANETNNQSSATTTVKADPLAALREAKASALRNQNTVSSNNSASTSSGSELAAKFKQFQNNNGSAIAETDQLRRMKDDNNARIAQRQINSIDESKITEFVQIDETKPSGEVIEILNTKLSDMPPINIDIKDNTIDGMTTLMYQARFGTIEAMKWLLNRDLKSANPNITDNNDMTAIMHAVLANDPKKVQLLMEKGANYDKDTLLTTANFIDGDKTNIIDYINKLPQGGVGGRKTNKRNTKGRKTKGRKTKGRKTKGRKTKGRKTTRRRR